MRRRDMTEATSDQIVRLAYDGGDTWYKDDASYLKWRNGMLKTREAKRLKQ